MNKIFLIAFLTSYISVFTQGFDSLVAKKQLDCSDISYSSGLLFERYFNVNEMDSAKSLLMYWQGKCGLREPIQRAKLLIAIKENNFQDSLLTEDVLSYIFNYQDRIDIIKHNNQYLSDNYKPYYGYIPLGQEFDNFTKKSFHNLKSNFGINKMEYLICEFYSTNTDTIFSKLQTNHYDNSILSKEYKKTTNKFLNMAELHGALITGLWIPTGDLKKLGTHPELGFQFGLKHKKMNYDLIIAFKFLNSANNYYARRTKYSNLELTNHFFGGHISVDVGRDIYAKNAHEVQLIGGIAFDGFDALQADKNLSLQVASVQTYNFSFGIGYRYYIKNNFYLGLKTKYNIVDYSLNNIIDFTGNPITIQFIIGGVNNVFRNNILKVLKYKLRK